MPVCMFVRIVTFKLNDLWLNLAHWFYTWPCLYQIRRSLSDNDLLIWPRHGMIVIGHRSKFMVIGYRMKSSAVALHCSTRAQQLLRWATVWPQWAWAESGQGLMWGAGSPLGPHVTQCGLGRGQPHYQVASWSIQTFGHNCRNATLLRVGIRLRTIFIPGLVVKTFTGCVHWVIARCQLNSSK